MNRSHRTLSQLLSPALAAVALTVFLSACNSSATLDDESTESSSEAMMEASSAMMDDTSSTGMMDDTTSSAAMMNDGSAAATDTSSTMAAQNKYADGVYNADGVYRSPAGMEDIQVTLTLKDDVVTGAQVQSMASNPKSKMMQGQFIAGYSAFVVGKPIDQLSLGVVNGSSLTPQGFMDAVAKIKVEAAS